jgi:glycosyltransferase involved in cell wall biosynthesis
VSFDVFGTAAPSQPRDGGLNRDALEQALEQAGRERRHLLIRFADVVVPPEAIRMLEAELAADPMFGAAVPRVLADDGSVWPLVQSRLPNTAHSRRLLAALPDRYISTEMLSPCLLVRSEIAANFGPLDRSYQSTAGAVLDMLSRARRAGFRTVVCNRAGVRLTHGSPFEGVALPRVDEERLAQRYPERPRLPWDVGPERLAREEAVQASLPDLGAAPSMLLDATDLPAAFNGMSYVSLALSDALHGQCPWPIDLMAAAEAAKFHELKARFPKWRVLTSMPDRPRTIGLRLSQPWHPHELFGLHRLALFNVFLMLDCVAWDVGYLRPPELATIWQSISQAADALIFISAFSRDRFEVRFPCAADVRREVCLLSCDPADYRRAATAVKAGSMLVIGNNLEHKHVNRTVELLVRAFPYAPMTVVGATSAPSRVDRRSSGQIPDAEMEQLYSSADLIVVPSFYEGFSLPVAHGLSYGRTVIARRSTLLDEIVREWPAQGRLVEFSTPEELVDKIGLLLHGRPVAEIPLGRQGAPHQPRNWSRVAGDLIRMLESLVAGGVTPRWSRRNALMPYSSSSDAAWP